MKEVNEVYSLKHTLMKRLLRGISGEKREYGRRTRLCTSTHSTERKVFLAKVTHIEYKDKMQITRHHSKK